MKLIQNENHILAGYECISCKGYNDITDNPCIFCKSYISDESFRTRSAVTWLIRSGEFIDMSSSEVIELHAKFFSAEKVIIKELDTLQLEERRETLKKIVLEAKARLTAHDDEKSERAKRSGKKSDEWLLTSSYNDPNVTDAILAVKERKQRMSAADKQLEKLRSLGIDGPEADAMIAKLMANKTGSAITSTASRVLVDKQVSPVSEACKTNAHHVCSGTNSNEKPCECKCHKPKVIFDPNSINFKRS